ncbi:MAG: hypothetical protein EXS49_01335 [Candidatus Pacebacteria bacterium]|nr:hypothetical protein [Candidatus Paceibacterota bacterium]
MFFLSAFLLHLSGGSFLLQLLIILMSISLYGFELKGFFRFFFPFLYSLILSFISALHFQGINFLVSSFSASIVFFISLGLKSNYFEKKKEWNYILANFIFFYALFEFNGFQLVELFVLLPVLFLSIIFLFVGAMGLGDEEGNILSGLRAGFLKSSILALLITEYFFVARLIFVNGEFIAYFLSLITIIISYFLVFRERVNYRNVTISFSIMAFVILFMLLL